MTGTEERILNSRYRIESLIGRGGMADVYLGHDLSLDRQVAVKMLRPDLARDPQFQGRFRREAQSSASLNHRNIVGVYDTGRADVEDSHHDQVKTPYIVMEYVDGVTLRHILHGTPRAEDTGDISGEETVAASPADHAGDAHSPPPPPPSRRRSHEQDGRDGSSTDSDVLALGDTDQVEETEHGPATEVGEPLQRKIDQALGRPVSEQDAAQYMSGILRALQYSHDKGIVHRDIKPSNVMVGQDGEVKVMDFGIARALADSASTMTQTSTVVGTAQYLSPEQARGEVVDHRSDLYSAGCVLFELLTNRPPFQGESPVSVAYQHVREEPPQVSDLNPMVSPAMESVVHKALTKDPVYRFQNAAEFDHALQNALHGIAVDDSEAPTSAINAVGASGARNFNDVVGAGAAGVGTPLSARTPEDPDLYEEYEEPRRRRGFAWIFWVLLLIALLGGGAWALTQMLSTDDVEVPDVEGLERSEAISELTDANLEPEIEMVADDEVEPEIAVGTDPEAGSSAAAGTEVILMISSGPDDIVIPDGMQGETEESVRQTLEDLGLEIGDVSEENHQSVEEGSLISTSPEAGTAVAAGSAVDLVLSTGLVTFPGVFNTWYWDAQETLEAQGFTVQIDWQDRTDYDEGRVVGQSVGGQSVQAGDNIAQGSTVVLAVAYEPEEEEDEEDTSDDETSDDETSDGEGGDSGNDGEGNNDSGNDSGNGNGGNGNDDSGDGDGSNDNGGNGNGNNDDEE